MAVGRIQGDDGAVPEDWNKDYKHAAQNFQRALDKYNESELPGQKAKCKEIMHNHMEVMRQIDLDRQGKLLKQTSQLEQDLNALDKDDSATNKLQKDLKKIV